MLSFLDDLCGNIYITPSKNLIYRCIFCENCFELSDDFLKHNLKDHVQYDEKNCKNEPLDEYIAQSQEQDDFANENSNTRNSNKSAEKLEELEIKIEMPNENNLEPDNIYEDNDCLTILSAVENDENSTINCCPDSELIKIDEISEKRAKYFQCELEHFDENNLECKYCNKRFNKLIHLNHHINDHLNFVLTCIVCGKHYSRISLAKTHSKSHIKLKCDMCDVSYSTEKALRNHVQRHEMSKCKYCSKVFKKPYAYRSHLRTHTGEKPYKCDYCSAAFVDKSNLLSHKFTQHTGDIKDFSCKFCERKFKTKQLQDQHTRRVHLKEKPNQCEMCGLNFANMSGLRRHKLKHHTEYDKRPHHCKLCDKKFVELKNLTEHMNTHTGQKPYQCEICFKGFGHPTTLREHKKLHSGRKEHVCKICGKAFAQHAGCANHMKQHHIITDITSP